MPTFSETITSYNNAKATIAAQQAIIDTAINELVGHAQNAHDNGAGGFTAGFLQEGDNFITKDGLTFRVILNANDEVTGVQVHPNAAPSFDLDA